MSEEADSLLISGRRVVSVVFCDICNFTSISERLDAEEVFELINNIFELLTNEVERCGGYVDKYIGDCVMAIFGAGRSDGAHAEEAISAALAMQERLTNITHPICRNRGIKLQIRIGVNSGLVYAGYVGGKDNKQFTVMGDTVNLAQRMEQMARPGSILVAAATARQVVHDFVLEEVGNLEVKGKSKEVRAFRILRPRENRIEDHNLNFEGITVPTWVSRIHAAQLAQASEHAFTESTPTMLCIRGQRDNGNLHHLSGVLGHIIHDNPEVMAVTGRCADELENELSAFIDIYRKMTASGAIPKPAEDSPTIRTAQAILGERNTSQETDYDLYLHTAQTLILDTLLQMSANKPLILVFEDASALDLHSSQLIESLLGSNNQIMILLDVNDRKLQQHSISVSELTAKCQFSLNIDLLEKERMNQLIGLLLSCEPPAWLIDWVTSQCGGKLLHLLESLEFLLDTDIITLDTKKGSYVVPSTLPKDISLPPTVLNAIQRRLDDLEPGLAEVLKAASIFEDTFTEDQVAVMLADPEQGAIAERSLTTLQSLNIHRSMLALLHKRVIGISLKHEDPRQTQYQFQNPTAREATFDLVSLKKRKRYFNQLAESLIKEYPLGVTAERIAKNFELAEKFPESFVWYFRAMQVGHAHRNERQLQVVVERLHSIESKQNSLLLDYYSESSLEIVRLWSSVSLLFIKGEYLTCIKLLENLDSIKPSGFADQTPLFIEGLIKLWSLKAQCFDKTGAHEESIAPIQQAIEIATDFEMKPVLIIDLEAELTDYYRTAKLTAEALALATKAITTHSTAAQAHPELQHGLARHYDTLGLVSLFNLNQPKQALAHLNQALSLRENSSNVRLLSISLMNIGIALAFLDKNDEAAGKLLEALELRKT
ncbi:MAG: hypothetical protein HOK28_11125, partial [Deltaproteobacteria bacterium]|nr:hypothetical protein [Deltaproteobacteria bacterium]